MFAYCNNNPVIYRDATGQKREIVPPKSYISPIPKGDEDILEKINEAGLNTTTHWYQGKRFEGDYVVYKYQSEFRTRHEQFLWFRNVVVEYTTAEYYFEKVVYYDEYDFYNRTYGFVQDLTIMLYDFSNCGSLGHPFFDIAQAAVGGLTWLFGPLDEIWRDRISKYSIREDFVLYKVIIKEHSNSSVMYSKTIYV